MSDFAVSIHKKDIYDTTPLPQDQGIWEKKELKKDTVDWKDCFIVVSSGHDSDIICAPDIATGMDVFIRPS